MVAAHLDTESVHEHVVVRRGVRPGLPIVVAVHSTALGHAIVGCRLPHYPHWRDGLTDALRLWATTSDKCAVAGCPPAAARPSSSCPGQDTDAAARREVLHDAGDVIAGLNGAYATGPDVGTGPDDMVTIASGPACVLPNGKRR